MRATIYPRVYVCIYIFTPSPTSSFSRYAAASANIAIRTRITEASVYSTMEFGSYLPSFVSFLSFLSFFILFPNLLGFWFRFILSVEQVDGCSDELEKIRKDFDSMVMAALWTHWQRSRSPYSFVQERGSIWRDFLISGDYKWNATSNGKLSSRILYTFSIPSSSSLPSLQGFSYLSEELWIIKAA